MTAPAEGNNPPATASRRHVWKIRLFRLGAVAVGLSLIGVLELLVRLSGVAPEQAGDSAYLEFDSERRLFESDADGEYLQTASDRTGFFAVDRFRKTKQPDSLRAFVIGGSTVQGRPFSIQTAFPQYLKTALPAATGMDAEYFETVNCGGVSYACPRLLPIVREVLEYEPDVLIVCTGHNEFLEAVTYRDILSRNRLLTESEGVLQQLHLFRLLRRSLNPPSGTSTQTDRLPGEVDAMLDHSDGLQVYRREILLRDETTERFRRAIHRIADLAEAEETPLLLILPCDNLIDCPPFKSQWTDPEDAETHSAVARAIQESSKLLETEAFGEAAELMQSAIRRDPQYALSWYQQGRILLARAESERSEELRQQARAALVRARDEDVCPLRMTSSLREVMRETARERRLMLLDMAGVVSADWMQLQNEVQRQLSGAGQDRELLIGNDVLVDHVHPEFTGHQKIGAALVWCLAETGLIQVHNPDWLQSAREEYDNELQQLDSLYFLRGRRTLQDLQGWAAGRAKGPSIGR